MKVLYLGSNEKKNSGKELEKIEICWKEVENELKKKGENIKRKLNNMEEIQMEYW